MSPARLHPTGRRFGFIWTETLGLQWSTIKSPCGCFLPSSFRPTQKLLHGMTLKFGPLPHLTASSRICLNLECSCYFNMAVSIYKVTLSTWFLLPPCLRHGLQKKKPVIPWMHCQETQLLSARTDWKKKKQPTPRLMPCLAVLTSTLRSSSFWLNSEVFLCSYEGYLFHFAHEVVPHMPLKCPLRESWTHNGKHPLPSSLMSSSVIPRRSRCQDI